MQWRHSRELVILPDGKHFVSFRDEFPLEFACFVFDASHYNVPNHHDYLEIFYVFDGEGVFYVGNQTVRVTPGDFILMGTTQMHHVEAVDGQTMRMIGVYFLPEFLFPADSKSTESEYQRLFVTQPAGNAAGFTRGTDRDGTMLDLLTTMDREIQAKDEWYQQATKVLLLRILLVVMRSHGTFFPSQGESGPELSAWTKRMQPAISHIHAHIGEKITTAGLASVVHMSPSYFCRFFKQMSGITPTDYILRVRINTARMFLLQTDMSITQIAFRVGFQNQSYFDKVFKRLTKATPRDFRRKHLKNA